MTNASLLNPQKTWTSFYQSLPRQLVALSRYLQAESMSHLKNTYDHKELRLHFEPYIYLLGVEDRRITGLAEQLSVSKQACNQVVDKLEQLGYVERRADEHDGRAKRVVLTTLGKKLIEDGVKVSIALDKECVEKIGAHALIDMQKSLRALCDEAGLLKSKINIPKEVLKTTQALLMLLPRFGDDAHRQFLQIIIKQYPQLKPSHLECFTLMGGCQGHLKRIAQLQGVSASAAAQFAKELAEWGFVEPNALELNGNRFSKMALTDAGWQLLAAATKADQQLEKKWLGSLGEEKLTQLKQHASSLYAELNLAEKMLGQQDRIKLLVKQLREQLAEDELHQVAKILLAPNTG